MVRVSVIVPVYNVEKYLRKCLNSLVRQTFSEIEIIVVNDGSTDNSQMIIDEFQQRFPDRIKSFRKENGGLSDARNFGLDKASGEYIGFVDSDDYVSEMMFEEMYFLAQKCFAEIVICNLHKVDEMGTVTQKLPQVPNMPEKIDLDKNFSVFSDISYFACNKIFKKELFEHHRFKKGVHFEDIQLIPQLLLECKNLAHTNNYHYQYFERSDSITKTHTEKGLDMLKAVEDVEVAFKNSVYSDKEKELKDFQILEGVYSFLAYLAFVKDGNTFDRMSRALKQFCKQRNIKNSDILSYKRFGENYLRSLPFKKRVYYLMYFYGGKNLLKKLLS